MRRGPEAGSAASVAIERRIGAEEARRAANGSLWARRRPNTPPLRLHRKEDARRPGAVRIVRAGVVGRVAKVASELFRARIKRRRTVAVRTTVGVRMTGPVDAGIERRGMAGAHAGAVVPEGGAIDVRLAIVGLADADAPGRVHRAAWVDRARAVAVRRAFALRAPVRGTRGVRPERRARRRRRSVHRRSSTRAIRSRRGIGRPVCVPSARHQGQGARQRRTEDLLRHSSSSSHAFSLRYCSQIFSAFATLRS
jgi:hypothetical protein